MELVLQREVLSDQATIGRLKFAVDDGVADIFTLEDPWRLVKIAGNTAIPEGRFQVIIDFSNRFQRLMPHVLNVPGFTGVRIHSGNTSEDTEGCILIGLQKGVDSIGRSRAAMELFMPRLEEGLKQGEVWIEILNPRKETQ